MAKCRAKAKSTGVQCQRNAVTGYTVCQVHGAGSPKKGRPGGINHVLKANGRYSKYIPTRIAARYEEATYDPDLLNLREDVALTDARLSDLLGRVDTGESGHAWRQADTAYKAMQAALARDDDSAYASAYQQLGLVIKLGLADYAAWDEINKLLDQRRRLVESERKRLVEMQQMITSEQMVLLVTAIAGIVKQYVDDRHKLNAIQNGIQELLLTGT